MMRGTHVPQRAKKTIGYARHTHHPGTLDVDERHVVDRGKSLDRIATAGLLVDLSSARTWVESVSDPDRDLLSRHRVRGEGPGERGGGGCAPNCHKCGIGLKR